MTEQTPQTPDGAEGGAAMASALVKARNERGFTQAQLADLSGVSRSAIKGYETGRTMPGARELKALCATLQVSPTVLLYGSEQAFANRLSGEQGTETVEFQLQLRYQLQGMAKLLADDEVASLLKLARAIVVARLGVQAADEQMRIVAEATEVYQGPGGPKAKAALDRFVEAIDAEDEIYAVEADKLLSEWHERVAAAKKAKGS
jgi:transcriptional regulator with XRE-family HTH domain